MTRRMFRNDPVRITFFKDYRWLVHGDLLPGKTTTIVYDADRLPRERSIVDGRAAWTIQAYYQARERGEVNTIALHSETGAVRTKLTTEAGEGTMMVGCVALPDDAEYLALWFLNTGSSGEQYWDSNFGRNYMFRFVIDDVIVESAELVRGPSAQAGSFRIAISALPAVSQPAVHYRIMNGPAGPSSERQLTLGAAGVASEHERLRWTGAVDIPETAVIRYTLHYVADGFPHQDTNTGKGYLVWAGAQRNLAAGVL